MTDDTNQTDAVQPVAIDAAPVAPLETLAAEQPIPPTLEPAQGDQSAAESLPDHAENWFSDHDKAFFRTNIRWIMAELDLARSGLTASEREALNP